MVRPDHEERAILSSDDDDLRREQTEQSDGTEQSDQPEQAATPQRRAAHVVRRSSPLERRKKRSAPVSQEAAEESAAEEPADETAAETDSDAVEGPADEGASEPDADELGRNAHYRERRRSKAVVRRSATGSSGRRSPVTVVAVSATALLVVVGVVISTVFGIQYASIQKDRELRAEYSTFAQKMVVSLFTLDPDNADQMYKNTMNNTSGRARAMFEENMKGVADRIREGDMVTKTTVLAEAVSKAEADDGSVLVVLGWEGHPKNDKKAAQSMSLRLRVDITRINGKLKMTYLDWVA